jgi:hypothetical protein
MRILVDVSPSHLDALNVLAEQAGQSRAEVIRKPLDSYVAAHQDPVTSFSGLWASQPETQDAQGFLDEIRGEW